jgi:hypothetical protein
MDTPLPHSDGTVTPFLLRFVALGEIEVGATGE